MSVTTLLQYHRVLMQGFSQQWQQRVAVRVAAQRLMGHEVEGWRTSLAPDASISGCTLVRAEVSGAFQAQATLTRLRC